MGAEVGVSRRNVKEESAFVNVRGHEWCRHEHHPKSRIVQGYLAARPVRLRLLPKPIDLA
ncbi:MAG: hypothetical protein AVDCRST_MAG62-1695, partial [uncultured Sphingomonas sp.]